MENVNYNSINEEELALFSNYLYQISGIVIPPEKSYLFETRLSKMMVDAGAASFGALYRYILSGADPFAGQKIINAMTTNETLWFRDASPWKVMEEKLLPGLIEALRSGIRSRIRIWCAAVSTGQEAYSTAMCVDDYLSKNQIKDVTLSDFEFFSTDISSRVLELAKKGRYDAISIMRGLNDYYRTKYFIRDRSAWDLDTKIRNAVHFAHFNLQNSYHNLGFFDIIFCRYVLIYFSQESKKEIIAKTHSALTDNGVLFTGTYALFDVIEDYFNTHSYENLTYYTKKAVKK